MADNRTLAAGLVLVAALTLGIGRALADGQSVSVEPTTAKPGDLITINGQDLGANHQIEVVVLGMDGETMLGSTRASPEGDITAQFALPKDLASGSYLLRARGKEDVDASLTIVGAPTSDAGETSLQPQPRPMGEPPVRERPLAETAVLVDFFGMLSGFGLFFASLARDRAERTEAAEAAR